MGVPMITRARARRKYEPFVYTGMTFTPPGMLPAADSARYAALGLNSNGVFSPGRGMRLSG